MSEHVLELRRYACGVFLDALSRLGVEASGRVPHRGVALGGLVALALHGVQVEQLGSPNVFHLPQYAHQLLHVVAVVGAEVAYVETLKDVLLSGKSRLEGVVEA